MKVVDTARMVDAIQRRGESRDVALNRLKSWVREGVFDDFLVDSQPGSGRSRQYRESALISAALLQVLTECTGMPAVKVAPMLDDARESALRNWPRGKKRTALIISNSLDGTHEISAGPVSKISEYLATLNHDTHTVVDLNKLAARLSLTEN